MPNIGPLEVAIVLIIAVLILGPKKLPDVGRSLGKGIREFRGSIGGGNEKDAQDGARVASSAGSAERRGS